VFDYVDETNRNNVSSGLSDSQRVSTLCARQFTSSSSHTSSTPNLVVQWAGLKTKVPICVVSPVNGNFSLSDEPR
jgi:hypothetical protein